MEPFYKTTSEVATLSYVRADSSAPVPRIVAHSSTVDNDIGFEWTLMEKIPGVSLKSVRRDMDVETRERETLVVARYAKQLHDQRSFDVIGNLYFREDLSDRVRSVSTTGDRFVIGPIVIAFVFASGRKPRLPRNLEPYSDDAQYMAAPADAEAEDVKFLQLPGTRTDDDFDEGVAGDAPKILEALRASGNLDGTFPSRPQVP